MKTLRSLAIGLLMVTVLLLASQPQTAHADPPMDGPIVHIVRWGETLTRIAARYGVSVYEIAQANRIPDPNHIYVGQQLVVPVQPAPLPEPSSDTTVHVVQPGDTLARLAVQYHSTVYAIVQANRLVNPSYIYVGQILVIPTQSSAPSGVYYTVRAGDTLAGVAYRFGVNYWAIVQGNNLRYPYLIYPGQVLFVPGAVAPPGEPTPTPTSTPIPGGTAVDGWAGKVVSNPAGSQFDDYFEKEGGEHFGIEGLNETVGQQIASYRDTGVTVYVWGTLYDNVPDVNGKQIRVSYISESPTRPPTPTPTPMATSGPKPPQVWPSPTWDPSSCTPPPVTPESTPPGECPIPTATVIPLGPVPLPSPFPPKSLHMNTPEYGMQVNVWGMGNCITDRDLRLVKDAGFTWVRQVFRWRDIEPRRGEYHWDEADRVVAMVAKYQLDLAIAVSHQPEWAGGNYPLNGPPRNMADFKAFMGVLSQRYKGLVRAYEIWPGPNVSENWGGMAPDPHRYAEMLIVGYWGVKEQDIFAMVISGGLVQTAQHDGQAKPPIEFFKVLYEETDANQASDVWGVEALGFKAAPENTPEELALPHMNNNFPATAELNTTWGFRSVEVLQQYAAERAIQKQFVATKIGWTTDPNERSRVHWARVSEEVKADHLRRAYYWAKDNWQDWMGVMFVPLTDARLTMNDEDYWWSIVDPNGCPRKAYYAVKEMGK